MIEIAERVYTFAQKLPLGPERIAFYMGLFSIAEGMYEIEFDSPLVGGTMAILGTLAIGASLNTEIAHSIIDNAPHS